MPKRCAALTLLTLTAATACTTQPASPPSATRAPTTSRPAAATPAVPTLIFLSGTAAKNEMINDAMEPYFSRLQLAEMEMKTGQPFPAGTLDDQRQECRRRFQNGVADFSPEEQAILTSAVERARALTTDYPLYHDLPFSFIGNNGTIEGGFSYTRAGSIILTHTTLQRALRNPTPAAINSLAHLLLHEQSHVFQRKYPRIMADLYTTLWHFEKIPPVPLDPSLFAKHLFNPDGTDDTWAYPIGSPSDNTYILPSLTAEKPAAAPTWNMSRDLHMIAIPLTRTGTTFTPELTSDGKTKTVPLDAYRDYTQHFPVSGNYYHPNEIAAEAFAIIASAEGNTPARWIPERDWFRTHLQPPPTKSP